MTEQGGLAPNCPVVRLSGERCSIWDFMQGQTAGPSLRGAWMGVFAGGGAGGMESLNVTTPAAHFLASCPLPTS